MFSLVNLIKSNNVIQSLEGGPTCPESHFVRKYYEDGSSSIRDGSPDPRIDSQ